MQPWSPRLTVYFQQATSTDHNAQDEMVLNNKMYHLQMFTVRDMLTTSNHKEMHMSLEAVKGRLEGTLDFAHGIEPEIEFALIDTLKI